VEVIAPRDRQRVANEENADMLHIEFKADAPQKLYSSVLEEKIYGLARNWQYSDDEILQAATEDLLEWAKAEKLIQK